MEPGTEGAASIYTPYVSSDAEQGSRGRALTSVGPGKQNYGPLSMPTSRRPWPMTGPGQWLLRTHMELGALTSAVPCARLHSRQVLWEWHQQSLIETAEVVVSELMTNAITAAQAIKSDYPVRLWLLSDASRTLIAIGDPSHHPPRLIDATVDGSSGRGLMLVQALSSDWGWYATHKLQTAKVVWAELQVVPDDGQPANANEDE